MNNRFPMKLWNQNPKTPSSERVGIVDKPLSSMLKRPEPNGAGSFGFFRATSLSALLLLAACGKEEAPPPPPPPSESSVDDLLRNLQQAKPPPAEPSRLTANPGGVEFSFAEVGATVAPQIASVMITNTGDQDISISNIKLAGASNVFGLGGSCRAGFNVTKTQSCDVAITFTPTVSQPYSADLLITHTGDESPLFIALNALPSLPPVAVAPVQPIDTGPDPLAINAQRVAQARSQSKLLTMPAEPSVAGVGGIRSLDPNYEALGFPASLSSLPVDRSRMITADRYIPAVLENSISTSIPTGRAISVIENHVYSSDNRFILIPAGTRVVGEYAGPSSQGEGRLQVNWTRMIRPDGSNLRIGFASADVSGQSGIPGYIDNRLWDKYGVPLLLSAINAAFVYAAAPTSTVTSSATTGTTTTQTLTPGDLAFQQFSSDLSSLVNQIIQNNVDLRPIVTVPGGTRLLIIPTQDLVMKTPQLLTADGTEAPFDVAEARRRLLLGNNNPANKSLPLQVRQPQIGDDTGLMGNAIDGTAGGALNDLPGSNNLGFGAPLSLGSGAPMAASPAPGTLGTLVIPGGTQPAVTDNSQPLPAIINSQGATQQAAPDQPISLLP
jgi:type IV secretion system protein VirB10